MSLGERGIVTVDVGTSAIRVTLLSPSGDVLASQSAPTPIDRPRPGAATLDAESCWRLTAETVRAVAAGREVAAVGVSAQLGTVLVDHAGAALTPVLLWADRTAEPHLDWVRHRLAASGGPALGRRLAPELPGVRLRMLAVERPEVLDAAAAVLSLKDYLVARLTGELVTDPTHASYTLLFDVADGAWSPWLADRLDLPLGLLPQVRAADQVAGAVTETAAERCGIAVGTAVAVGGPDGTVGSLGAGAIAAGRTVDIAGSTDVLVHVVDRPVFDPADVISTNAHPLAGRWTIGGATGMTGGALAWFAELFGYPDVGAMHDELGPALAEAPIGSRGVLVDPALTGHRFPYWDLRRTGAVSGLTVGHRREDVLNAVLEGAAFLVGDGLRAMRDVGEQPELVVVVGGAARLPDVLRLRASAWSVPVEGVADGMATSRGAALLAGVAGGVFESVDEAAIHICRSGVVYEPEPAAQAKLAEAQATWAAAFGHK